MSVKRTKSGKYTARVVRNGADIHLGTFDTKKEAERQIQVYSVIHPSLGPWGYKKAEGYKTAGQQVIDEHQRTVQERRAAFRVVRNDHTA